jgi:PDZ domain-containing protein
MSWKRVVSSIALPLVVGLTWLGFSYRLPSYGIGPGPAREVEPLISVEGHQVYPSQGKLVMTTISFRQLTPVTAVAAWLDPNEDVVSRDLLYAPGESVAQEEQRAVSQMDQSKIDAAYVVLSALAGYPGEHGRGALLEGVAPGCPAAGKLFPGDVIVAIDGARVADRDAASQTLDAVPVDEAVSFEVRAEGERHTYELTRNRCLDSGDPIFGISMIDNFPFKISIASGDVGGPSAGLMWALGLYDLLTPGDLTGGRVIAGTGEIDPHGNVMPIGGILHKVVAADAADADVLLVPEGNRAELAGVQTELRLVYVATFTDAVDYLEGAPGSG